VLVAVEGGTVGECLVVPDEDPEFVPSQQVATLRVLRGGEIDPWYLGAWLSSDQGRQRLMMLTRGSTIKRIAVKDLEKFEVPVPEMAVQKRIGERYRAFSASILAHEEAVSNLKALRMVDLLVAFAVDDPVAAARSGSGDARDRASTVEPASAVPVGESAAIEIEGGKS
ncbi:MAG: restriction endonuclease subunit S, partial [Actinomycetes bacterium]